MKTNKGKYNYKIANRLVQAVSSGMSQRNASKLIGISEDTFSRWKREHKEFADKLEASSQMFLAKNLEIIQKAGERSWQASAWLVERTFPQEYSPKLTQDITSNQPVVVNVDMQGTYKPPVQSVTQPQEKKQIEPS